MLLGTLVSSFFRKYVSMKGATPIIAGKLTIRACEETIRAGKRPVRAGEGTIIACQIC